MTSSHLHPIHIYIKKKKMQQQRHFGAARVLIRIKIKNLRENEFIEWTKIVLCKYETGSVKKDCNEGSQVQLNIPIIISP